MVETFLHVTQSKRVPLPIQVQSILQIWMSGADHRAGPLISSALSTRRSGILPGPTDQSLTGSETGIYESYADIII